MSASSKRELEIKKLSHSREWAVKECVSNLALLYFKGEEHFKTVIRAWFEFFPPHVLLCSVAECKALWVHASWSSQGYLTESWNSCPKCGHTCAEHKTCAHTSEEKSLFYQNCPSLVSTSFVAPFSLTEPRKCSLEIDPLITTLTRDVLNVVRQHLLALEKEDFEQSLGSFRSLAQLEFVLAFSDSDGDVKLDLCNYCTAFQLRLRSRNPSDKKDNLLVGCQRIHWLKVVDITDDEKVACDGEVSIYVPCCDKCL